MGLGNSRTRSIAMGVGVLAVVLAVSACTGKDEEKADPTSSQSASSGRASGGEQRTVADLSKALFAQDSGAVLGTATGELPGQGYGLGQRREVVPAKVEVLEVAGAFTTFVRYRMTYLGEGEVDVGLYAFDRNGDGVSYSIRETEIVVPKENKRFKPYTGVNDLNPDPMYSMCVCTWSFADFSAAVPVLMSASFPALAPEIKTISLDVPGFPVIENLPVTRG